MSKINFETYPIKDLTGGINLRDYKTEIDEKQCLTCENFNFEGDKLVSGSGVELLYNTGNIQGLTKSGDDIYYIAGANVYKNGEALYLANEYEVTFGAIDGQLFSINIDGVDKVYKFGFYGNESLALADLETQLNTDFAYLDITRTGSVFTISNSGATVSISNPNLIKKLNISNWSEYHKLDITVDGTTYSFDGDTYSTTTDIYNYIISQLSSDFIAYVSGGYLYIGKKNTSFSLSGTSYDRYTYRLAYQYNDTPSTGQYWANTVTTIDGNNITTPGTGGRAFRGYNIVYKLLGYETISDTTSGGTNDIVTNWHGARILTKSYSTVLRTVEVYNTDITQVRLTDNSGTVLQTVSVSGVTATFNYTLSPNTYYRIETYNSNFSGGDYDRYYRNYSGAGNNLQSIQAWRSGSLGSINQACNIASITTSTPRVNPAIYGYSGTIDTDIGDYSYFYINKLDYSTISLSTINNYTNPTSYPPDTLYSSITTTNNKATIEVSSANLVSFTQENIGLDLTSDDLYSITVSNWGILIVGSRGFSPTFIFNDGTVEEIPIQAIGQPRFGIIYNGRIIFGGYKKNNIYNDNIVYGKTPDALHPEDIIEFGEYNGGSQSVSGGNAGELTGFITGEEGLYAFKTDSVYISRPENDINIESENPNTGVKEYNFSFVFSKITNTGALNNNCITQVQQDIFYYDGVNKCVRRLSYEKNQQTLRDTNISKEVEKYFKAIPEDNEVANERFTNLIHSSFNYPNYEINIPSINSPYFYLSGSNEDLKYRIPDTTLLFNVDSGAWSTRTDTVNLNQLYSANGLFFNENNIYINGISNTLEDGVFESKVYTLNGVDSLYKRFGGFDIVGDLIPDSGETKTITIDILINGELEETRVISSDTFKSFRERIDLYYDGQDFQFKITHSGKGKVAITDCYITYKQLPYYQSEFY